VTPEQEERAVVAVETIATKLTAILPLVQQLEAHQALQVTDWQAIRDYLAQFGIPGRAP
jgi:hypothetical protein